MDPVVDVLSSDHFGRRRMHGLFIAGSAFWAACLVLLRFLTPRRADPPTGA